MATYKGTANYDIYNGTNGNDTISGLGGNDTLSGLAGDDIIDGGSGNDTLYGGTGNDTYIYGIGYGYDTIKETNDLPSSGSTDQVIFTGLSQNAVKFQKAYNWRDILVTIKATNESLTIIDGFNLILADFQVEAFVFTDSTLTLAQINTLTNLGGSGNDRLVGWAADDTLDGKGGNDNLYGESGNDTYIFSTGYGNDTITEQNGNIDYGNTDQVIFTGLSQNAVKFQKAYNGRDIVVTIKATNESLTINNGFDFVHTDFQVEAFVFTDGTLTLAQINTLTNLGGSGNDILFGWAGEDTLDGKGGNDELYGGYGNDTYVFSTGYGNDTITEQHSEFDSGDTDQVIFSGLSQSAVKFHKTNGGRDLQTTIIATNETLTINDGLNSVIPAHQVEMLVFADGTVTLAQASALASIGDASNEMLWGTAGNDILDGKGGDDTLYGESGDDTYLFGIGYGNDTIEEYSFLPGFNGSDQVIFTGLAKSAVKFQKINNGKDLLVTIKATNETLTISKAFFLDTGWEVEALKFTDGTLTSTQLNTQLNIGGAGNDTLWGTMGNDTLNGKGGTDTLYGGDGNDNYVFGMGYGNDTIAESDDIYLTFGYGGNDKVTFTGLSKNDVKFQKANNGLDLLATIIATNETLTISWGLNSSIAFYVESFVFTDGTLSLTEIKKPFNIGSADNETLWGTGGNDTLDGKGGDDTLYGDDGNDTYIFGIGYGNDIVSEFDDNSLNYPSGGNDQIIFTGLSQSAVKFQKINNGLDLQVTIIDTNKTLTIKYAFGENIGYQLESLVFTDGILIPTQLNNQLNIGGAGNDTLWGTAGNDTLDGKGGTDIMYGGDGNDTYIYGIGYGKDSISEFSGTDQIKISGYNITDLSGFTKSNNDLIITFGSTNQITVYNQFFDHPIESIQFANGDVLTKFIFGITFDDTLIGTANNDFLKGLAAGADLFSGGMGDDLYFVDNTGDAITEEVNAGKDTVLSSINYTLADNVENLKLLAGGVSATGNSLDNHLTGNNGNNNLYGKAGADVMVGGKGNDTYSVENIGDSIIELSNEGTDKVTSSITWTLGANLENLSLSGIQAINGIGNGLNNIINGNAAANALFGDAGADSLTGGNGRDTLVGGIGKDKLYLAETVAVTDTVKITTGDSKWNGYDEVANFALGKGVTNTAADLLDLDTIKIAANAAVVNGVDKGIIKSHSISNGLITFDDMDSFAASLALSASNLTDVFGYLQNNIKSGNTVAFNAIGNTYVFQDGGLIDTVVQLTGVTASNINTTGLVADGVWLV